MKDVVTHYAAKTSRPVSIVAVVVMILAALSACTQGSNGTISFTDSTPITIGASLSNKGDFAADGKAVEKGYLLWQQTINHSGGLLGRPVKLDILHDDSDPSHVAANYNTLINKDHVDLVIGPFSTLLTKAVAPIAASANYALIEGSGGGPSVFQLNQTLKPHNIFDVSVPVANNLVTFADYILSLPQSLSSNHPLRPTTAAYATSDDPFTQPQLAIAEGMMVQGGIKTVYSNSGLPGDEQPYSADDPKYVTKSIPGVAEKIVKSHAQVVLLGTQFPDVQAYLTVFKKDHYNPEAIVATAGPDQGQDFVNAVGGAQYAEGMFVPNGWYPQANNFQNAQMVADYLAQYGGTANDINADVAEAYSVGQVLEQAVTRIHSIDNAALIKELQTDVFNSVQGPVQFPPEQFGANTQSLAYLFQWQNGSFLPVYPSSVAAQNPEFPKVKNY
jgi:branched-chain amino acid transport system substrate-binding protein